MHNKQSNRIVSNFLGRGKTADRFCRPLFLTLFILGAAFNIFTAHSLESGGSLTVLDKSSSSLMDSKKSSNKNSGQGSYSIFQGTMADMTWIDVEKAASEGAVILLTTAVIEEHGPHMGCGIDTYLGYNTCKLVRRTLESKGIKTLIAPPFYWGINRTTKVFPGTFTVREETMKALLHDIFTSLKNMNFKDIYILNSHGDGLHITTGIEAVKESRESLKINIRYVLTDDDIKNLELKGDEDYIAVYKSLPKKQTSQKGLDIHAGALETGLVAAFFPGLVDTAIAKVLRPTDITKENSGEWIRDARWATPLGYVGDPAKFDAEEAKKYWEASCKKMADSIKNTREKVKK